MCRHSLAPSSERKTSWLCQEEIISPATNPEPATFPVDDEYHAGKGIFSSPDRETPRTARVKRGMAGEPERDAHFIVRFRSSVEAAIEALGCGFLRAKRNIRLRERLRTGRLLPLDYYRQLQRLVFRLLVLFVAEETKTESGDTLFHPPGTPASVRDRFARLHSVGRLRNLATGCGGTAQADLYESLTLLFLKLRDGDFALGIPRLGSFLFSPTSTPDLDSASLANGDLLAALRRLCFFDVASVDEGDVGPPIEFAELRSEQLGTVYESLLELHPVVDIEADRFTLQTAAGHERKATGSYYTPRSLINRMLDSALDPLIAVAINVAGPKAAEQGLLNLKICDPACGAGHFLVAAAERMAISLARVRTSHDRPARLDVRRARRDVIGRCLYGVDVNPMAVELCKVSLWMEAREPGKPLSSFDHHIRCGNSLLGARPRDLANGIPDEAFTPVEEDDKSVCAILREQSRRERKQYEHEVRDVDRVRGSTCRDLTLQADAWCAASVWRKDNTSLGNHCPTDGSFRHLESAHDSPPPQVRAEIERLRDKLQFFHWHLAFPEVFAAGGLSQAAGREGWSGGFDVVLGNPPWVSYAGRQQVEIAAGELNLLRNRFPAIARWPASHPAFLLLATQILREGGRAGLVLPRQVADLAAYGGARKEVLSRAEPAGPVVDVGEDCFPGVTQPVGLFTLVRRENIGAATSASWPLEGLSEQAVRHSEPGHTRLLISEAFSQLAKSLSERACFAPKTFADPGVHTGNVSRKVIRSSRPRGDGSWAPVREGRDIMAFYCGSPHKWLCTEPSLEDGEYCTIRGLDRYDNAPILIRQTADRPIAARHLDSTYFRNSLLVCNGVAGVSDAIVVAYLNSALYAFLHRSTARDARQKAFPQVKVKHLQALPAIPVEQFGQQSQDRTLREELQAAVADVEAVAGPESRPPRTLLERIERLVLRSFDLSADLAPHLLKEMG